MKKTIRRTADNSIVSKEGVRQGFNQRDAIFLRRETYTPKTQVFSVEELEPEPEERYYYCAICKSKLDYLKGSDTIWRCDNCMEYYDTKIQDSLLKNISDSQLRPYADLQHYPVVDEDGMPFVEAIDVNRAYNLEERKPDDQRILHINLHNVRFADAILKGALSAKKNQQ